MIAKTLPILAAILIATPAAAADPPKSEAGTAFIDRCLADVIDHRIETLKRQAPDYAATLTPKQLFAGASAKAESVCPCFLQVIGVSDDGAGETPEERVAAFVAYLDAMMNETTSEPPPVPPVMMRLTRLCGQRASILPPRWVMR